MHHVSATALPIPPARSTFGRRIASPSGGSSRSQAVRLHPTGDPWRTTVERFIADVYLRAYGARIPGFAPMLVSIADDHGIVAAAGWRSASDPLYLERYLDAPIDACIARSSGGMPPERARIAEVGHLAAIRAGEGRRLMVRLGLHLASIGYRWVASTATPGVRATFERAGVHGIVLGPATREAAGADGEAWGSYYASGPSVIAGELLPNLARTLPRVLR